MTRDLIAKVSLPSTKAFQKKLRKCTTIDEVYVLIQANWTISLEVR